MMCFQRLSSSNAANDEVHAPLLDIVCSYLDRHAPVCTQTQVMTGFKLNVRQEGCPYEPPKCTWDHRRKGFFSYSYDCRSANIDVPVTEYDGKVVQFESNDGEQSLCMEAGDPVMFTPCSAANNNQKWYVSPELYPCTQDRVTGCPGFALVPYPFETSGKVLAVSENVPSGLVLLSKGSLSDNMRFVLSYSPKNHQSVSELVFPFESNGANDKAPVGRAMNEGRPYSGAKVNQAIATTSVSC